MSVVMERRLRRREPRSGSYQPDTESEPDDLGLLEGPRQLPPQTAPTKVSSRPAVSEAEDEVPEREFLQVLKKLQAQPELGLRLNDKGNQVCELSWVDFWARVPHRWTDQYPNVCPLCRKRLSSRFSLSRHYIDVHHREEKRLPPPARCPFCHKILYNQSTLNRHLQTVHKGRSAAAYIRGRSSHKHPTSAKLPQQSPDHPVVDTELNNGFSAASVSPVYAEDDPHNVDVTPIDAEEMDNALDASPPRLAQKESPFPVCLSTPPGWPECEPVSTRLQNTGVPPVSCPLCEETFPSSTEAARHVRSSHCAVCQRCGLRMPEPLMDRHTTAHQLKMAFWCPVCGQREEQRQAMVQHLTSRHAQETQPGRFQCGTCGLVENHELVTHCLKHARDDAHTAHWFKPDVLTPWELRGLDAGRLLLDSSDSDSDSDWLWLPLDQLSVRLLRPSDSLTSAGADAALLSASLCPVCGGPVPSGGQLGTHLIRHGALPLLACPDCALTFWCPATAGAHRCRRLLCLLCGLQVPPRRVTPHWRLHAGSDDVCALLDAETEENGASEGERGGDAGGDSGSSAASRLSCDRCERRVGSVCQLRRHRLHVHGVSRGPLCCPHCPIRFFRASHRRAHRCDAGGAEECQAGCVHCGACPVLGRAVTLVSGSGRRQRLSVCGRCGCPLPESDPPQTPPETGTQSAGGVGVCGDCDAPLPAGASALLTAGDCGSLTAFARPVCVPCGELRLSAAPGCVWRPEAWLGALWCYTCCRPQHSLQQLRLHCLREHADNL